VLNELKTLSDSIQAAGFTGVEWDDHFKEIKVKGSPCFVVSLSDDGNIADIRHLPQEKAKCLRTWQGGSNGQCFPGFNFQPFFCIPESSSGKAGKLSAQQKNAALHDLAAAFASGTEMPDSIGSIGKAPRDKADAKTAKCLGSVAQQFFATVAAGQTPDDSLVKFSEAFRKLVPDGADAARTFNEKLFAYLRRNVSSDMILANEDTSISCLLFRASADVVLFLDLYDPEALPVASERSMQTINGRLLSANRAARGNEMESGKVRDAFGLLSRPADFAAKLPEVKLPGAVAVTKLRSMNKESPCQTRYGFIDAESFPVGPESRKAAKIALSWIASPEREGKTWAIAGKDELVFAYPKTMPPSPPSLAGIFGNGRNSTAAGDILADRFEQYAVEALKGLKTLSRSSPANTEIEVFAIKKADKARRKVVFYRNYSLAQLDTAVTDWLAGARNIPPIRLLKWPAIPKGQKAQKGTRPVPLDFHAPLPLASIERTYTMWAQDGAEKREPPFRSALLHERLPVFDGLELFLGEAVASGLAERLLSFLLQGSTGLVAACGNLGRKGAVLNNTTAVAHLETALPLLGILLEKLDRTKETYMENAPYLIGKFLNLADGLHAVWCKNVKGKDPLPPQLLGSSFFASFQLNPVQAFANMGLRMKPYCDWARTNSTESAGLSRWFLSEIGRTAAAIKTAGIPARLSDADKAEMLLGYLSFTGKNGDPDSTTEQDTPTQGNENE
jgi:hypothetical protein